jgi:hypothetical protein
MNYREINLINNTLIIAPNETRNCRCSPREEIAHPLKLKTIIDTIALSQTILPLQWEIYRHTINAYYTYWFPWSKTYKNYDKTIQTSLFHVITERPAMFGLFSKIVNNPKYSRENCKSQSEESNDYTRELHEWLLRWWNCPFLITIPIMHNDSGTFITNNMYPPNRKYISEYPPCEYLDLQIAHQSYTIANGLTVFLAYQRLGIISAHVAYPIVHAFINITEPNLFQDVTDTWYDLYYNTVIGHIADFPSLYVTMGPSFAHENIVKLFDQMTDFQFPEIIIPTTMVYTSPYVAMLPYFNKRLWEHFKTIESWLNCLSIDYENGDLIIPDMSGFIHAMLTTKGAWKFWTENCEEILLSMIEVYVSNEKLLLNLLQICSYYYIYGSPYHTRSLKRKSRLMWQTILNILDGDHVFMPELLKNILLKHQMCERLIYIGKGDVYSINEFPYSLFKDIFIMYENELSIYTTTNYIIISGHSKILRTIYPDILHKPALIENIIIPEAQPQQVQQGGINQQNILTNAIIEQLLTTPTYYIQRSIIHLMKNCFQCSIIRQFHDNYIEKRIVLKLGIIYKAFGMYYNNPEYTLYNNYTVGSPVIEHLKINKNILIEW